jgi:diguanylate cyclase (GGDEF)-like protein
VFAERSRLLARLALMLAAGFLAVSLAGFWVSRESIRRDIAEQALPLTGDTIYSEIQKDVLRPVFISSLMAHDTFLRDWMLAGEHDTSRIARYLAEVKAKYGTVSSFLVSARTGRYYYAEGLLKTVSEREPRDAWFYRVRAMAAPYEINVDPDMANRDAMTIFINYRVHDYQGQFMGATGVGLTLDTMSRLLESYEERFHRRVYFVDAAGRTVLAGRSLRGRRASIRDTEGIGQIADRILEPDLKPTRFEYEQDGATVLVNARYIPELNWYLLVEQSEAEALAPARRVLAVNLAISAVVTVLVLATALVAINRYQRRLEKVAATDPLTGLFNRQAFDLIFRVALKEAERSREPLAAILFDIDHFKQINDSRGHLAGDRVIRAVAELARASLRQADVVARWGGEEFLVLLKDCPVECARTVAEKLRAAVAAHDFGPAGGPLRLTVSLGVAQWAPGDSADALFNRADEALYRAKAGGRNRVEIAAAM